MSISTKRNLFSFLFLFFFFNIFISINILFLFLLKIKNFSRIIIDFYEVASQNLFTAIFDSCSKQWKNQVLLSYAGHGYFRRSWNPLFVDLAWSDTNFYIWKENPEKGIFFSTFVDSQMIIGTSVEKSRIHAPEINLISRQTFRTFTHASVHALGQWFLTGVPRNYESPFFFCIIITTLHN